MSVLALVVELAAACVADAIIRFQKRCLRSRDGGEAGGAAGSADSRALH